jgi:hypothetical protein
MKIAPGNLVLGLDIFTMHGNSCARGKPIRSAKVLISLKTVSWYFFEINLWHKK